MYAMYEELENRDRLQIAQRSAAMALSRHVGAYMIFFWEFFFWGGIIYISHQSILLPTTNDGIPISHLRCAYTLLRVLFISSI